MVLSLSSACIHTMFLKTEQRCVLSNPSQPLNRPFHLKTVEGILSCPRSPYMWFQRGHNASPGSQWMESTCRVERKCWQEFGWPFRRKILLSEMEMMLTNAFTLSHELVNPGGTLEVQPQTTNLQPRIRASIWPTTSQGLANLTDPLVLWRLYCSLLRTRRGIPQLWNPAKALCCFSPQRLSVFTDIRLLTLFPQGPPMEVYNVPDDWLWLRVCKCLDSPPTEVLVKGKGPGVLRVSCHID